MQGARGWQKVLEDPTKAKNIYQIIDSASWCEGYHKIYAEFFNEPLLIKEDINTKYFRKQIIFNTQERYNAYIQYDTLLSGDTYSTPAVDKNMSQYCDPNTTKYEE